MYTINCNYNYNAIKSVFIKLNTNYKGKKFCIPQIGGGNWIIIKYIINQITQYIDELVEF